VHPLIPRDVLFGNPDRTMARVSPDGSKVSFIAPKDGVLNLWVGPALDPTQAAAITHDRGRGVQHYAWMYAGDRILFAQDKDGDENWRVFAVDVATQEVTDLTPYDGVAAQIVGVSHRHPDVVILGLNDRNPQLHDLWRVNVATGARDLLIENEGFAGFVLDDDLTVRFAIAMSETGGWNYFLRDGDAWRPFLSVPQEDALTTQLIGFDATGRVVYTVDSRGRNTAALFATNLDTGARDGLAEDPRADISAVLQHPTTRVIQAAVSNYDRRRIHVLDPSLQADLDHLGAKLPGDLDVVSRSLDDQRWVVASIVDDGPLRYFLYDRPTQKRYHLFANRAALEGVKLAKMRPVTIPARDGLPLVSYLTLPSWVPVGEVPKKALPAVILVHGGPWARDQWGFDPNHQWLANRGYAVLSVNFRGSTGFGKAFTNAGDHEWSGKMQDDLLDGVVWLVRQKIANPEKIAIMGGSYGGYAALVGLTFTPEVFACGVDIVGPSNLVTLIASIPPYWAPLRKQLTSRMGDPDTPQGKADLEARSPLFRARDVVRPLLIGQGANDPRVKQAESDQIVRAMTENGVPVEYALFPDEGHGFARPENRLAFFALAEGFLARHLGGRDEGLKDALSKSSVILREDN
jgi:dipeptidyl aminopeptidase/acylaminoacyl peptidase